MATETKPVVKYEDTLAQLDIRLGRIVDVTPEPSASKSSYRLTVDFGKYGTKQSVGRFTQHSPEELLGKQVLGVLNFEPRTIGEAVSEVLILGVQYPKAVGGEATFLTPAVEAKLGSKVF